MCFSSVAYSCGLGLDPGLGADGGQERQNSRAQEILANRRIILLVFKVYQLNLSINQYNHRK
jgi:hypothetical protein